MLSVTPLGLPLQCFVVRSLGWVEIPEEDLAPGKSSIAVNNCIQQLSQSKCEGRDPASSWGEVSPFPGMGQRLLGATGSWEERGSAHKCQDTDPRVLASIKPG